jgi:MinD-like ATPase involved in chromosome partitioning or flagellar assembly
MTLRPHIFTFYSYKGGVGRSMALLNVAYTLHSLGRHVLMVDLDLEAPGVSGFLRRYEELETTDEHKPDVVDLLSDLMPAVQWEMGDASRPKLPVLGKYLRSVKSDGTKYAPAKNLRFRRTRLDVLCASDERDYAERLGALDIAKLTGKQLEIAGNLIREVFFGHEFPWSWLETEEEKPTRYDYILIDSRTGFTETSGLCIGPLADRLVLFCGLNDQNINGTAEFLKVVGLKPSTQGEAWDDDVPKESEEAPGLGQKPTLLIASPVPFGEMEMKKARFAAMEKVLGAAPDARISYHPRLSIIETVFCRDGAEESIRQEYDDIAMSLLSMVGDHPDQWERRIQPSNAKGQLGTEAVRRFASLDEREGRRINRSLIFWANRSMEQAEQKTEAEAEGLLRAAEEKYQAAQAIKPDDHAVLFNWGNALLAQAQHNTGAKAEGLFGAAEEKYQAALAIKPDDHDVLYNLACLCALREEVTSCLAFLSDAEKYGEGLTKAKLDKDSDFDRVRTDPAFVAFRNALPAGEAT